MVEHQSPTDEELATRTQAGDVEAFGTLVERYEQKLLRYGRKFLSTPEDIEDVVQEVFMRTYENIKSFDAAQKFSPWIYRIAHNSFINELRKRSRAPLVYVDYMDFDTLVPHAVRDDSALRAQDERDMQTMLEKGLERLAPKYREVLVLYYIEELSYKEIADILEVPVGTVGIRLKRAKEALRAVYDTLGIEL